MMKRIFYTAAVLLLFGCGGKKGGPPPGMAVKVVGAVAKMETLAESVPLVGTIAANEAVDVKSEIEGKIKEINFVEGQKVSVGDPLFTIDAKKLIFRLSRAEADFRLAKADLERSRALFKRKTISSQEYDRARSTFEVSKANADLAREKLADATITAPFNGVVGARLVSPGQFISKGQKLTELQSLDPVKIEASVPERYFSKLKTGMAVKLQTASLPGRSFGGKVYFVSPSVDPVSRTVFIKAKLPNPDFALRPGMFASISLELSSKEDAVLIPEKALMPEGNTVSVYVISADGKAELREIKTGRRLEGKIEVLSGLKAGERIVSEGVQKVRPGAKLAVRFFGQKEQL